MFLFCTWLDAVLLPERSTIIPPHCSLPLGFFLLNSRGARRVDWACLHTILKIRHWGIRLLKRSVSVWFNTAWGMIFACVRFLVKVVTAGRAAWLFDLVLGNVFKQSVFHMCEACGCWVDVNSLKGCGLIRRNIMASNYPSSWAARSLSRLLYSVWYCLTREKS